MSVSGGTPDEREPVAPMRVEGLFRASMDDQRLGLALLLANRADPRDPAVEPFMQFAQSQGLDLSELWIAQVDGRPRLAALLIPGEGRTGTLLLSPLDETDHAPVMTQLVRRLTAQLDRSRIRLVQALLEPYQRLQRRTLVDADFRDLAVLAYMQVSRIKRTSAGAAPRPDRDLQMLNYDQTTRPLFEQAILASYENTLDCPGLLGLREIDDIIAGHQSAGVFDPSMWFVLSDGEQPAAVMLLNALSGRQAVELVYLGIAPAYRRRGLGKRLLDFGLWRAAQHGAMSMLVAVDEENAPAVRLYRRAGFVVTGRKIAMIHPLDES